MRIIKPAVLAALTATVEILAHKPVLADAIDGNWCREGRHLAIDGPDLITPGGNRIKGNYDRHGFEYVVPTGEKGAGQPVSMVLQDDDHMTLQQGEGGPQTWKRCPGPTS